MSSMLNRTRLAPVLAALAFLPACDETPPVRESITPRQDPDEEPPPVTETPFDGLDPSMLVSELEAEDLPALCEMGWHWLTHPETKRRGQYVRARCLHAVHETKLEGVEQCESKLERCEASLPVGRYPSTICGLENVEEAGQCDVPLELLEKCVTAFADRVSETAGSLSCKVIVGDPAPPLTVPEACAVLPPSCSAAVGLS